MANLSPATALAALTPRVFRFPNRTVINYQVDFFSDVEGTVSLPSSAGGSADLTFEGQYVGNGLVGSDPNPQPIELQFAPFLPDGIVPGVLGGTLRGFGLGAGACCVRITPTAIVAAAGAQSYRIHVPSAKEVS